MNLKFDLKDKEHISRHLWGSAVLCGKFNPKIKDVNDFLTKLSLWLDSQINISTIDWIHNNKSGTDTVELPFKADTKLKNMFGLSSDEFFGYDGVVEISADLRSKVIQKSRGDDGADKIEVNIIEGIEPKPIDDFVVELKIRPDQDGIFIATAYPGIPGPNLPDKLSQTEEEYKKNKEYWDKNAFLKF